LTDERELFFQAVEQGEADKVSEALNAHAEWANLRRDNGSRPLHVVKNSDIAALLVKRGADIEARTESGDTPLHRAAYYGNQALIVWLLDNGAEMESTNERGRTPLHKTGVRPVWGKTIQGAMKAQAAAAKLLVARGADTNARDENMRTPMDLAKRNRHGYTVRAMRQPRLPNRQTP